MASSAVTLLTSARTATARVTGDARFNRIRGNFCNLRDTRGSGNQSIIYNSVLPTVYVRDRSRFDEWLQILRENGSEHVIPNVPDGGMSYGGIWDQPDLWNDLKTYRAFLETCLDTASASGNGFVPTIFLDDGGPDPLPRIRERWPRFASEMKPILKYLNGILAFEPVVGDWTSSEVSEGLKLLHSLMPEIGLGYHGSPRRLVGSSNPVEHDDPWQGGESIFYTSHGGEFIQFACYQTEHGPYIYSDCDPNSDDCWLNRLEDYIARIGAGYHGWRVLPFCLLETVAFEYIRSQATELQAREVASRAEPIAAKWGVTIGQGNGIPL